MNRPAVPPSSHRLGLETRGGGPDNRRIHATSLGGSAGRGRAEWGWCIEPARLYSLVAGDIATCMALGLQRIWHAYRRPMSPRQRVQAKFWFLATVVQTPFVLTNILPLYGVRIYPLGSLGNVFTMGIMGYAIARHRLMDVDYVVRKGVSFMLAATLVLVPGGAGIWALALVLDAQEPGIMVCAALALALIAVILIPASHAAIFRARAWEVAIPLRLHDRPPGLIALGRRRDFRIFSAEDLQLLAAVAAGASVALENAWLSRQLRRSEVVLERANRLSSLGMLAAGIAHEIRNPLVAVKTFLDLLPQRLDDRELLSHFRELSLGELRRVTDLIADLLALGKSKTAERRSVELGPTLEPVVRLMESTARKRHIEVAAAFDPRVPPAWADPDQLKQIIVNLLLNAIETSSAGGHVWLEVQPASAGSVVLEVRDDGPGIPANQLENIFHPFFTTKETGTGLGLALVHQMVVEHGGEITVESTVGRGSAFRVTLPTAPVALACTGT